MYKKYLLMKKEKQLLKQQLIWTKKSLYETMLFRHDIKNHLYLLQLLLENQQQKKALEYLKRLTQRTEALPIAVHTGNDILDMLLNSYQFLADKQKLVFSFHASKLPKPFFLTDTDFTALLVNILDNAFHAASGSHSRSPFVSLTLTRKKNSFLLLCKNSISCDTFPAAVPALLRQSPGSLPYHGYGLHIIKKTIKKYGGTLRTAKTDSLYLVLASFPLSRHRKKKLP